MGCYSEKDNSKKRPNPNLQKSENIESQPKPNSELNKDISNNPKLDEKNEIKEVKEELPKPFNEPLANNDNDVKQENIEVINEEIKDTNDINNLRNGQSPPPIESSQNENNENNNRESFSS